MLWAPINSVYTCKTFILEIELLPQFFCDNFFSKNRSSGTLATLPLPTNL